MIEVIFLAVKALIHILYPLTAQKVLIIHNVLEVISPF